MMNVFDNSLQMDVFHLVSRYIVAEDPLTGGGYSGVLELDWEGPAWVSPSSFESWLASETRDGRHLDPCEFLGGVMGHLWSSMDPTRLTVTLHVESVYHGSFALTKTMIREEE
jgi:hypothetical protein